MDVSVQSDGQTQDIEYYDIEEEQKNTSFACDIDSGSVFTLSRIEASERKGRLASTWV